MGKVPFNEPGSTVCRETFWIIVGLIDLGGGIDEDEI